MPRGKQTLEKKISNAWKKIRQILLKHDGSRDLLHIRFCDYQKYKNNNLKSSYNDWRTLRRHERTLELLDEDPSSPVQPVSRHVAPPQDRCTSRRVSRRSQSQVNNRNNANQTNNAINPVVQTAG